jgi:hypothetical protein
VSEIGEKEEILCLRQTAVPSNMECDKSGKVTSDMRDTDPAWREARQYIQYLNSWAMHEVGRGLASSGAVPDVGLRARIEHGKARREQVSACLERKYG